MTNPLVRISDLLDETANVFISQAFSGNYATPILYLLYELETRSIMDGSFSADDYEQSLESIQDAIGKRLEKGRWSS